VCIGGINYIVYNVQERIYDQKASTGATAKMLLGDKPYAFPKVWQMAAFVSSYLLFIAGLIMIILVTNEYSFKTHRQNVIDGLSRFQFILVKLVDGLIIASVSTLLVFLTGLFFGIYEGHTDLSFDNFQYIFYFFLQALSYCWLAIVFGLLFKRSGIALGVFFLYTLVIENVLALVLNRAFPESFFLTGFGDYLPTHAAGKLIPVPVLETVQKQFSVSQVNIGLQISLAIVYLVAYFIFTKWKFETSDL
jgi:ABC-type transport system involved in multi-copper enzyme maturation permease subunit